MRLGLTKARVGLRAFTSILPIWILSLPIVRAFLIELLCVAGAQATEVDCSGFDPITQVDFLKCVAKNVGSNRSERGLIFDNALQRDLSKLSQTLGYVGEVSDLNILKKLSSQLKAFPQENQDAITLLDNAISAQKGELRSVISPATLQVDAELDQYVEFVQKKLDYLLTDAVKFYDGGPFEIITRSNLAIAFQEAYFLDRDLNTSKNPEFKRRLETTAGTDRTGWLTRSIALLDDIISRLTSGDHDYLPLALRKNSVNDFRYRRATVLLLLKDKPRYVQALKYLAAANQDFSLVTSDVDHIYVYKLFYTPYKLKVIADTDSVGHVNVTPHIDDPNTIKRLYNPAQLALVSCSVRSGESDDSSFQLSQLVGGLAFSDYYVVVASANDRSILERMLSDFQSAIKSEPESQSSLEARVKQLEVSGFSREISDGARECGVTSDVAKKIFSPFSLQITLLKMDNFGRFQFHLIAGGRLNADQARIVASFFNGTSWLKPIMIRSKSADAYIARMKVGP